MKEMTYGHLVMPYYCSQKRLILSIIVVIATIVVGLGIGLGLSSKNNDRTFRLPKTVVPEYYNLEIQPYLIPEDLKFVGNVKIGLNCTEETGEIILHSKELEIDEESLSLEDNDGKKLIIAKVHYELHFDFMIIVLGQTLQKGKSYSLFINFRGKLSDNEKGFFVTTFTDKEANIHYTAVTMFDPINARKVFPCFDEPALKATFDITIVRWKNMSSLSNMPKMKTEKREGDWEADIFHTSVMMSTYVVAFFVGNYRNATKDMITIWTHPDKIYYVDYALDIAIKIFSGYHYQFQVPYVLPKLDIIAINASSFTEGWGLITILDELITSRSENGNQLHLQMFLAHEIGTQWFGSLVTPKWWNDIWLTKGIITLVLKEYLQVTISDNYVYTEIDNWFDSAEIDCSKQDVVPVSKVLNELEDLSYDHIYDFQTTFAKSSKIFEMIIFWVGTQHFWEGVVKMLKDNAYRNIDEDALWFYLTENESVYLGLHFKDLMEHWLHQKGQPALNIKRNYEKGTAFIEQISCRASFSEEDKNDLWSIPVALTTPDTQGMHSIWFSTKNVMVRDLPYKDKWILFDSQDIAVYSVNYDKKNWKLLARALQKDYTSFDYRQRLKLLNDIYRSTISFSTDGDVILEFYLYLRKESFPVILFSKCFDIFNIYSNLLVNTPIENTWNDYVDAVFHPISDEIRPYINKFFSSTSLYSFLCQRNDEQCLHIAHRRYQAWKNIDNNMLHHIDFVSLCAVARHGNDWEDIYQEFIHSSDPSTLAALTCSKEKDKIDRILKILLKVDIRVYYMTARKLILNKEMWTEFFEFLDQNFNLIISDEESFMRWDEGVFRKILHPKKIENLIHVLEKHMDDLDKKTAEIISQKFKTYKLIRSRLHSFLVTVTNWLNKKLWEKQ